MQPEISQSLYQIAKVITAAGGEIFVVGGPIRDLILGIKSKDIDFLVRLLTLEEIAKALEPLGKTSLVGDAFGIVKATINEFEFDFALPRLNEIKTGDKHTDFAVRLDPFATVEDDLGRRDFSCNSCAMLIGDFIEANAIALNHLKIIDPFGGIQDIKDKILRTVGNPKDRFEEDPLRMLRGLQFTARFGFTLAPEVLEAIKSFAPALHPKNNRVTGERIFEEFKKAWVKGSKNYNLFIENLKVTGIGETIFGPEFKPEPRFNNLQDPKGYQVRLRFVSSFLNGGDWPQMKPDNQCIKLLELAHKVRGNDAPHTFVKGPSTSLFADLNCLFIIFQKDEMLCAKLWKMLTIPCLQTDLKIGGEDIIKILNITDKKDMKKVGIAFKSLLQTFWDTPTLIQNDLESLSKFVKELDI